MLMVTLYNTKFESTLKIFKYTYVIINTRAAISRLIALKKVNYI